MTTAGGLADPPWELLDAAPDAMVVVDALGRIRFANAQVERVFGYSRAELTGGPLELLLPARFRSRHGQHFARYLSSPSVRPMGAGVDFLGQRKNGQEFPIEIALSSIEHGGMTLAIAAVRDVTARKQVEDELRRSREDLAITLESIGDGVIVADLQGRVVHLNPVAERLTGWPAKEAAGRSMEEVFRLINEETRAPVPSPVPQVLRDGSGAGLASHTVLIARDGTERPVADSCAPIRSGGGALRGAVLVFRDNTAEAAEQRSLRETARMQRQLDCAPLTVVRLDRRGRITHVNEAWRRFARESGAGPETIEGVGSDYLVAAGRVSEDWATAVAASLTEMVAGQREAFTCIYSCHSPTEIRWFRLDAERIAADDALVLVHTNITDHYVAEARLRLQSVVAQALADRLPFLDTCRYLIRTTCEELEWDFAAIWTADGDCLRCTDVWVRSGCEAPTLEQATRAATFQLGHGLPGRVWAGRKPEWIPDLAGDPSSPRAPFASGDGLKTGFAVPLGAEGEVFAVVEFFSRLQRKPDLALLELLATSGVQLGASLLRERAEERATAAELARRSLTSTLDAIMECAPAHILVVDGSGRIQFVNKVQPHQQREEVIGSDWLQYLPPAEHQQRRAQLQDILQAGVPRTFETTVTGPDGREQWFTMHLGPLRQGDRVVGAVLVSQEVTELKRIQLESAAAQRMAAVGTLAAGIAHEVNTPVQFVNDSVHFLRDAAQDLFGLVEKLQQVRRLAGEGAPVEALQAAIATATAGEEEADFPYLRENVPKALERCLDGLERIGTIVRSMKDFAHPARQEMAPIDLNRAVRNTLTIARGEYKYVAELETELGELAPVTCHGNDINQVVLNLVVNAAHAIGDAVKGSDKKGTLKLRTRQEGEHVVISISDTGAGIPEAIAHRIFEPFFTTKEVGKGTGQGLALAWSIVTEKHGGQLTFESKVGQGTTFFIRLPIAGKKATQGAEGGEG